jgi:hypothetical protein
MGRVPDELAAGFSLRRADVRCRGRCPRDEFMKTKLSIIKADIGSIGGHVTPSQRLLTTVRSFVAEHLAVLLAHQAHARLWPKIVSWFEARDSPSCS